MKYREGSKFFISEDVYDTQADAKQFCVKRKSHLASINNYDDIRAISSFGGKVWLGGTDEVNEGEWLWDDGTQVPNKSALSCKSKEKMTKEELNMHTTCQLWQDDHPKEGDHLNCLTQNQNRWYADTCTTLKGRSVWCEVLPINLTNSTQKTFQLDDMKFSQIEFWWQPNKSKLKNYCGARKIMPGFMISWTTQYNRQNLKPDNDIKLMKKKSTKIKYWKVLTKFYIYLQWHVRNMVLQSKKQNMTDVEIWDIVIMHKESLVIDRSVFCSNGYAETTYLDNIFETLKCKLSKKKMVIEYTETDQDRLLTFDIFSHLLYCDEEANQVYSFYHNLLHTGSVRAILQATVNNLKLTDLKDETRAALKQIYLKTVEMFGLQSGNILRALSDTKTTENMENNSNVFIKRPMNSNEKVGRFDLTYFKIHMPLYLR